MQPDLTSYLPSAQTTIIIGLFVAVYITYLLRKLIRENMDLYDFVMLSAVAALPFGLVFIPQLSDTVARLFGVSAGYLVLFSSLFVVLFLMMHRLISRINKLERQTRILIQETSTVAAKTKDLEVKST